VIGLVVFAVFGAAFGFGTSLYSLDALRFVQGVACGGIWGGALTWVIATAPRERRATVIGSVIAAATFGTLLGPLLGTLSVAAGTQVVFSAVGVISVALAVWARTYPEPERADPGEAPRRPWRFTPALALGTWLIALEAMTYGAVNVLIPLRMAHLGSPEVVIGAAFLATAAAGTVVGPLVGRVTDRRGPRPVLSAGIVVSALLLPTLPVMPTYVLVAVMLVITLGVPLGAYMIPAMTLMSDSAERAGITLVVVTTLFNLSYAAGETVGAPAAAAVSQATSDTVPLIAIAVLMLLTLLPARAIAGRPQTGSSVTSRLTSAA
jgi:MFS family permease